MFKSALRYIRQKPKAVRNQYALALSTVFTTVVAFIWLASGSYSLDKMGSSLKASEGNTPFSNLIKQAKDQFASSKSALSKAEQATSSVATTTTAIISTSGEMILSAETLDAINRSERSSSTSVTASTTNNFGPSSGDEAVSTPSRQYIEVQIATTTKASSTQDTSPQ